MGDLGLRRKDAWVLRGANLGLEAGRGFALLGESGAGKSTLLELAAGLLEPSEGEVRRGPGVSVAMVFQDAKASLPPHRRGLDILAEPLEVRGWDLPSRREAARAMAGRVGFPEAALGLRPQALSGGMAQRLALGRALVVQSSLLILDEPFASLDSESAAALAELVLAAKAEGTALLLATHDPALALRLCEDLAVLVAGEVVEQGPSGSLLRHPEHPYLKAYLEAWPGYFSVSSDLVQSFSSFSSL